MHVKEICLLLFQTTLMPGIYKLLDLCDKHAIAQLHTVLPSGVKEIFKTVFEQYHRYHKYTGRVWCEVIQSEHWSVEVRYADINFQWDWLITSGPYFSLLTQAIEHSLNYCMYLEWLLLFDSWMWYILPIMRLSNSHSILKEHAMWLCRIMHTSI